MNNLIFTIITVLSFAGTSLASNIGGKATILSSEKVVITIDKVADYIKSSSYNADSEDIEMVFKTVVTMVQIYDNNDEFIMAFPAGTEELNLGLTLFDSGRYKVGFLVAGQSEYQFTSLLIK